MDIRRVRSHESLQALLPLPEGSDSMDRNDEFAHGEKPLCCVDAMPATVCLA
jgi:hypothetical protein